MGDFIVIAVIAVIVGLAIHSLWKKKKNNKCSGGCDCCGGGCH